MKDYNTTRKELLKSLARNSGFPYPRSRASHRRESKWSEGEVSGEEVSEEEVSEEEEFDEQSDPEEIEVGAPDLKALSECYNRLCEEAEQQLINQLTSSGSNKTTASHVETCKGALPAAMKEILIKLRNHAKARERNGEDTSLWKWTGEVKDIECFTEADDPATIYQVKAEVTLTAKGTQGDEEVQCNYTARSTWFEDRGWLPVLVSRDDEFTSWSMRKVSDIDCDSIG